MSKDRHCRGARALAGLAVAVLASCASTPPSRFHTLSSLAGPGGEGKAPARSEKILGVGPVAMAQYLDHGGLTARSGPNVVIRSELDRWGGSLGDEVTRVLVEDLGVLLPGGRFLVVPWLETRAFDYRVQLNLTRFDGPLEGPVTLRAAWLVFGREGSAPLAAGEAVVTEPVEGKGYAALPGAMSRALAELARRLAAEVGAADGAVAK